MSGVENYPGIHLVSYYCSPEHLILKSAIFIKQGLDVGEQCYYYLPPLQDQYLQARLVGLGVDLVTVQNSGQLQVLPFNWLYQNFHTRGALDLNLSLSKMVNQSREKGFAGVRWLNNASQEFLQVDEEKFFKWEQTLDQLLNRVPIISLCLYDVEMLIKEEQPDSFSIFRTLDCHKYILSENKIIRAEQYKLSK